MYNSKIIETLEKYYEILDEGFEKELSEEKKFFAEYIEFDIAKGIIEELGKNTAIKIADMIKAFYTENPL